MVTGVTPQFVFRMEERINHNQSSKRHVVGDLSVL